MGPLKALLDYGVVVTALIASVGYAVSALGPRSWRLGMRAAGARALGAVGLARLAAKLNASSGSSCGACDNCGSESAPKVTGGEITIPVSQVSRRKAH